MIDSLHIKGFRCFENMSLEGFSIINIVTGSNASGKSALLEAIYLGTNASAHAVQNIAVMRGLPTAIAAANPMMSFFPFMIAAQPQAGLSTYFDHLFRSASTDGRIESAKTIEISFANKGQGASELKIFYQTEGTEPAPVSRTPNQAAAPPVIFARKTPTEIQPQPVTITLSPLGQLQQQPPTSKPLGPTTLIFGTQTNYAEIDNITWFSQLRVRNESDKVVSFIRREFPFVKDMETLAPSGSNGLFAIMTDGTRRPITTVSSGIYKIISILLATAHTRNGVIIIDEVENGIFYAKYAAIWRILYQFAKDTGNQIFVSSHSKECLQALPEVMGDNAQDFCLIRTERADEECKARCVTGTAMSAALAGGNEVRGLGDGH